MTTKKYIKKLLENYLAFLDTKTGWGRVVVLASLKEEMDKLDNTNVDTQLIDDIYTGFQIELKEKTGWGKKELKSKFRMTVIDELLNKI